MESPPVGFRFVPKDEEIINHYLRLKNDDRHSEVKVIAEIDICKHEPWDLPALSVIKTDDPEWFFFCPRERKYPNGNRLKRATNAGFWKSTGIDRNVKYNNTVIGKKKTLVFYRGRAPGDHTNWTIHEYRATENGLDSQGAFVLCRLFWKGDHTNFANIVLEHDEGGHAGSADIVLEHDEGGHAGWADVVFEHDDGGHAGSADIVLEHDEGGHAGPADIVLEHDEVDHNGSSPTATGSSPDDTLSDLEQETSASDVQETLTSDMQVSDQPQVIKRRLTDKSDNITPNPPVPVESSINCYIASDVENHAAEENGIEAYQQLEDNSNFYDPTCCQNDCQVFSTLQSQIQMELQPIVGSPFPCDFGIDNNAMPFKDGTSEPDISFTEFFNMYDELAKLQAIEATEQDSTFDEPEEESKLLKFDQSGDIPASGTGIKIRTRLPLHQPNPDNVVAQGSAPRRICLQMNRSPGLVCNCKVRDASCSEDEGEVQLTFTEAKETTEHSATFDELEKESKLLKFDNFVDQGTAARRIRLQMNRSVFNYEAKEAREQDSTFDEPEEESKLFKFGQSEDIPVAGTGIKIRTRLPLHRWDNVVAQGGPPRGIRCSEDEIQSTFTEAKEDTEHSATFDEPEEESKLLKFDSSGDVTKESFPELRLRAIQRGLLGCRHMGQSGLLDSSQMGLPEFPEARPPHDSPSSSLFYVVGVSLVVVLFIIFIGAWGCFGS